DIIKALEEDFSSRGEVICEIRVNGVVLEEVDEDRFKTNPSEAINDLAISTNQPSRLINDAIRSALAFIPEIELAAVSTAEDLRGTNVTGSRQAFVEILDGCQWLIDTIMHVRGAASGIGQPILNPEKWFEAEKLVGRVIGELTDAFTKSDIVLVADLLEYELPPSLSLWADALKEEQARRA
ncbi:MAG: hypothetical protein V4692_05165, partial [Bdellovibrionota bacterium]